jgi:hypothetical protein
MVHEKLVGVLTRHIEPLFKPEVRFAIIARLPGNSQLTANSPAGYYLPSHNTAASSMAYPLRQRVTAPPVKPVAGAGRM